MSSIYNTYPNDMEPILPEQSELWSDFFTFCFESLESRQAFCDLSDFPEDLRIVWIKKELGLGFCIGRKNNQVTFYRLGSMENWKIFKTNFCAKFVGDLS